MSKTPRSIGSPGARRGFSALVAVILLSAVTLAFSVTALDAAMLYADGVTAHEWRIQKDFNETACLDTARLMSAKDAFLKGPVGIPEFDCAANISNGAVSVVSVHFP